MTDVWPLEGFGEEVAARDRLVVLYYVGGTAESRDLVEAFDDMSPHSSVPLARADLRDRRDPRFAAFRLRALPTLTYYEHGEELERLEGTARRPLTEGEVESFLETVEDLQQKWRVVRGRLRPDRFG